MLRGLAARTQVLDRLPLVLTVILMLVMAHRLALLTWRVVPDGLQESIPEETEHPSTAVERKTSVDANVSQWNLFGKVDIAQPQVAEPVVIQETRLNLTLLGVISSDEKVFGKAIISDPSGGEDYYSLGMMVPGGASVQEIHADHVILKRNNRLEILRLPQEEALGVNMSASIPRPVQLPVDIASRRMQRSMVAAPTTMEQKSTGALLVELRDTLTSNPQNLADVIRTDPVRDGSNFMGYRINPGPDRQVLARFGLRPGDIVTTVNGIRLDSPAKGLELLQRLQTAKQMNFEVLRSGVTQAFSFNADP